MPHTTSWRLRPALPLLLLSFLFLIVTPIAGYTYGYRAIRQKRSPNESVDRSKSTTNTKVPKDFEANLDRIFKIGTGSGLVLFNDTSQSAQNDVMFKVQRSPDGKLNVIFNDFLIFQTTTSGTPTNNNYHINPNTHRNNDAIIFPDDRPMLADEYICNERLEGKPYCLDVPNYSETSGLDQIEAENFEKFKSYFKDDLVQPPNITQRMNSEPQEEYYCSSTSHLIYPKSAETKESKWLLVVQHENHKQGILVEQCDNEDKPCRFDDLLPKFYTSRCKQNYIFRTMVVTVNGKLQEEQVKMPSCCKCVLRNSQS